jgi:hypothetical protein
MPNKKTHEDFLQASRNIFNYLCEAKPDGGNNRWIAIVAYYKALHYIESNAADNGLHFKTHCDRLSYVEQQYGIDLKRSFNYLYIVSYLARYGEPPIDSCAPPNINQYTFRDYAITWLNRIKQKNNETNKSME